MSYYGPTYTLNLTYPDWAFDILGIDVRPDGFYLGTDSGCSCPMFWESHTEDDFTGPLTAEQAREEAMNLFDAANDREFYNSREAGNREEFVADLDEALNIEEN